QGLDGVGALLRGGGRRRRRPAGRGTPESARGLVRCRPGPYTSRVRRANGKTRSRRERGWTDAGQAPEIGGTDAGGCGLIVGRRKMSAKVANKAVRLSPCSNSQASYTAMAQ